MHKALCIISKPLVNSNWSYSPETLNSDQNQWFFCLAWPWNLMDYLEKQKGTSFILWYYVKPCTSFQSHGWIQIGVTVRKRSIRVKISNFLSCVTLKFDGWPWKTTGHLFYAASSLMHHFIAISELKLELQSGNAQLGPKSMIFFVPCDLEIWQMTLENNKVPLLCYFKLCASFGSHWWIQTVVTVRKCLIWVKNVNFVSRVTLKFDGCPKKQ